MPEGTSMNPEEVRQLNRDLMEKMLDKAASDPDWKQRLLDNPEMAMAEADFPESRQLNEAQPLLAGDAEVHGHVFCNFSFCDYYCYENSMHRVHTKPFECWGSDS